MLAHTKNSFQTLQLSLYLCKVEKKFWLNKRWLWHFTLNRYIKSVNGSLSVNCENRLALGLERLKCCIWVAYELDLEECVEERKVAHQIKQAIGLVKDDTSRG